MTSCHSDDLGDAEGGEAVHECDAHVDFGGLRKRTATSEHKFDTLYATLEIEHRLTPPNSPQTNGMVERFNGRIEEVLQSHHFRSGEDLETTLHRYVWLYNQQISQSALR
jgi:transposase InsO family protein